MFYINGTFLDYFLLLVRLFLDFLDFFCFLLVFFFLIFRRLPPFFRLGLKLGVSSGSGYINSCSFPGYGPLTSVSPVQPHFEHINPSPCFLLKICVSPFMHVGSLQNVMMPGLSFLGTWPRSANFFFFLVVCHHRDSFAFFGHCHVYFPFYPISYQELIYNGLLHH